MVVTKGCWREAEQKTGEGWGGRRIFLQGTRVRNDPQGENQVETPEPRMPTLQQGLSCTFISRLALLDGRDPKIGGEKAPQELIYPVPLQPGRDLAAKHM